MQRNRNHGSDPFAFEQAKIPPGPQGTDGFRQALVSAMLHAEDDLAEATFVRAQPDDPFKSEGFATAPCAIANFSQAGADAGRTALAALSGVMKKCASAGLAEIDCAREHGRAAGHANRRVDEMDRSLHEAGEMIAGGHIRFTEAGRAPPAGTIGETPAPAYAPRRGKSKTRRREGGSSPGQSGQILTTCTRAWKRLRSAILGKSCQFFAGTRFAECHEQPQSPP